MAKNTGLIIAGVAGIGAVAAVVLASKKASAKTVAQVATEKAAQTSAQQGLPPAEAQAVQRATAIATEEAYQAPYPTAPAVATQRAAEEVARVTQNPRAIRAATEAAAQTMQQAAPPPPPPAAPTPASMQELAYRSPGWPQPAAPSKTSATSAVAKVIPPEYQQMMAAAIQQNSAPMLSSLASQVEKIGFAKEANDLRERAKKIAAAKPPAAATVAEVQKQAPSLSPQAAAGVAKVVENIADPKMLQKTATTLKQAGLPQLANTVQQKADAATTAQTVQEGIKVVEQIMKTPPGGGAPAVPPSTPQIPPAPPPPPPVPMAPPQRQVEPPQALINPKAAAALNLASELTKMQAKYGGPKGAKWRSVKPVKAWQKSAGVSPADGLYGPGTALALAKSGAGALPLIMFWPRGSTAARVGRFRKDLMALAASIQPADPARAAQLIRSAQRERGQGGIAGPLAPQV